MRNGGSPPAHLSSSTAVALGESRWLYPPPHAPNALGPLFLDFLAQCEQIEKDFYCHWEEAERNKALIEQHRQDKAALVKAVANELTERHRHAATARTTTSADLAIAKDKWLEGIRC